MAPKSDNDGQAIAERLLALDPQIERARFFETLEDGATDFALRNPFAFMLASCLDRGTPSKVIWTIPWWLEQQLGHLDPQRLRAMSKAALAKAIEALPRSPRYRTAAPATIRELARIVADEFGGDARALWHGRQPAALRNTLRGIPGVGPGIASMTVQLVERVFPGEMATGNTAALDIKPDVHTRRVLRRLGQAKEDTDDAAIAAARRMHPKNPGRIDGALWYVGHVWCHARAPECYACYLADLCPSAER